jgi:hypothetical protein
LILAAVGTPALLGFAWLADGHRALIQAFVVVAAVGWVLAFAVLMYIGYQEDGIVGALYQRRHPLGSQLLGDPPASWMRYSVGWLVILAAILTGVLMSRNPGAIPEKWLHRSKAGSNVRDQLLK